VPVLTSIMGMNVEVPSQVWERSSDGPSIDTQAPFWTIIAVMIAVAGFMALWMKKKNFL
jgi:Mg2+ and Co2+ transporter CorA